MNKSNKFALTLALVSTGVTGMVVGALVLSKPDFDNGISFAETKSEKKVNDIDYSSSEIASRLSRDFASIAKDVTPAIVSIYSTKIVKQQNPSSDFFDDPFLKRFFGVPEHGAPDNERELKQQGLGSGVIIDKNGTILTNNHVVEGAQDISVTLSDKRKFKAEVVGTDPKTDLAVIKLVNAKNIPIAKLGNSSDIQVGEWVLAIGNPLGLTSTVTAGIISAKGRADVGVADFEDFIQTDAAINPGNSGGALVNLNGEVIGINTAIASRSGGYMGIGFAIPSNMAQKVMKDLIAKGKVSRGFLGVQIQNMTPSFAKSLRVEDPNHGIIVSDVFDDSPAGKAGIKRYDVILELNGETVQDVNSFRNKIASKDPGDSVNLTILRNGKKTGIKIKLDELGDQKISSQPSQQNNDDQMASGTKFGIDVEPLTNQLRNQLGIKGNIKGVIISDVDQNSNASEAGLMRGDLIVEINQSQISSVGDFNKVAGSVPKGDSVLMRIIRRGQTFLIAFTNQ